jgi:hypothetical protein
MQLCMGPLWWLQRNRFVLWTYRHHLVAWFLQQQQRRQLEHGWRGGIFGGLPTVNLLRQWALLGAVAKFGSATATVLLAWVLLVRGPKGFGREQEGGRKSVHANGVDRVTGLTQIFYD